MSTSAYTPAPQDLPPEGATLQELLTLEQVDTDVFLSSTLLTEARPLYGGQVFAQSLIAAGTTVPSERRVHSAHGYFLRRGDSSKPVLLRVSRDRDGRSLSARRVVALQDGNVIANFASSFAGPSSEESVEQAAVAPAVGPPDRLTPPARLVGIEHSLPEQAGPVVTYPTHAWFRCKEALLASPLLDAAVLAYVSDLYTGAGLLPSSRGRRQPTVDHALWFHRVPPASSWVLCALQSRHVGRGRSFYTGSLWSESGELLASLAQESLYLPA